MEVRTRFAPSPTGYLHLGGARTALFNALYAKHHGGRFVLRIEDTDRERSSKEFVDAILSGLEWLGIEHDEGPLFQSERSDFYKTMVDRLFDADRAYHCFCSPERLAEQREAAEREGRKAMYDRTCRELGRRPDAGESAVVRFKSLMEGETVVNDLVRGDVVFPNQELDDLILVRSDGSPTFHLVVVADDVDMRISHVLRGEDHLSNTPRQIQICEAFGETPPAYGHLPLIVGSDRSRLSKRHGATSVDAYREQGFLPSAVINYLARLGWSHGDQEIFGWSELVEYFDVGGVNKSAAAFDMEKFAWVNAEHLRAADNADLAQAVMPFYAEPRPPRKLLDEVLPLLKERAQTLVELADKSKYFVSDDIRYDAKAADKFLTAEALDRLGALADALDGVDDWTQAEIESAFASVLTRFDIKLGKLAQPTRVALTGGTQSPGIYEVCQVLGQARTTARLRFVTERSRAGALPLAAK